MATEKQQTSGHQWIRSDYHTAEARCATCGETCMMLVRPARNGVQVNCPTCGMFKRGELATRGQR